MNLKNIWALVQKEFKHNFYSPIAYVVLMIFLTLSGYFFYAGLVRFSQQYTYFKSMMQIYQNPEMLSRLNLNEWVIAPSLFNMIFIFLFMIPLIMMRSFAEERNRKTDELLKTSPISTLDYVAGKFMGALAFVLVMILPTVIYQITLFFYLPSPPELAPVVLGYVGVVLFACAGISIGLFASSLTENQIIGAVITFVLLLFMFIINLINLPESSKLYDLVRYISVTEHVKNLLRGLLDSRDLVYFFSICALFLFLTKRSLEAQGWR